MGFEKQTDMIRNEILSSLIKQCLSSSLCETSVTEEKGEEENG